MRADPWPELKKGLGDFLKDYLDSDLEYESDDPYSRNWVSPGSCQDRSRPKFVASTAQVQALILAQVQW
ncbi:hypothetical protein ACFX11_046669 [Malus domestica]